jgi:hypothetical protein
VLEDAKRLEAGGDFPLIKYTDIISIAKAV